MKKLFITEKPSVAQQFASVLGVKRTSKTDGYIEDNDYVITWCVGHLVSMLYPDAYGEEYKIWNLDVLPFLPEEYKYGVISSVKKQYGVVHKMLHRSDIDTVYWAGDSGREGQVIEENIRRYGGVRKGMKELRVWIDSQTSDEIKRGIREAKPMSAYDNVAASGIMRAIEDYAMGINFSRSFTVKYGQLLNNAADLKKYTTISVGRVMTCVLGMVVDRERAIRNFKEETFYKIVGSFGGDGISAEWKLTDKSAYFNNAGLFKDCGFLNISDAENMIKALNGKPAKIDNIEIKDSKKAAPLLFNLAELQNICSKKFKISPDETLEIAQALYEKKLTTYPRTDARVLSSAVAVEISKNIKGLHKGYSDTSKYTDIILNEELYRNINKSKYTDDSKITDHYAIIPTGETDALSSLTELQHNVYDLIVKRFLSIFYPGATYKTVKLSFTVENELFTTSSKCLVNKGYLEILNVSDDNDESKTDNKQLPFASSVKVGDAIQVKGYDTKEGKTSPPNRYNSGSLILAMENAGSLIEDEELRSWIKSTGIGTSATRGEILKKLTNIGYLKINKSTQIVTPCNLGEMVYEVVNLTIPEMLNPKLSAIWDKELEEINNGEITFSAYKLKMDDYIRKMTDTIKKEDKTDNVANNIKSFATGIISADSASKKPSLLDGCKCPICGGQIVKNSFGYVCSNYKNTGCKFGISNKIAGKTISENIVKTLLIDGITPLIKGFKSKAGKLFDAKLKLNNGVIKFDFPEFIKEESSITCPKCGKSLIKDNFYFNCNCGFKISHMICSKNISDSDMKELISNKKTGVIKGFKSKAGKLFNAKLILEDNKIKFDFVEK